MLRLLSVVSFVFATNLYVESAKAREPVSKIGTLVCTTSDAPSTALATADVRLSCSLSLEGRGETKLNGFVARKGDADFPPGKRVLLWSVLAATIDVDQSDLVGRFTGRTGGTKSGRLVGGRDHEVILDPITATSQIGGKPAPTVLHLRIEAVKA